MRKNRDYELFYGSQYPKIPIKTNTTSLFLLPACGMGDMQSIPIHKDYYPVKDPYQKLLYFGYKSCYSYWSYKDYGNTIYYIFNPQIYVLNNTWHLFYEFLIKLPTFVEIIQLEIGIVLVILRIEEKWGNVKDIIMQGKFSYVPKNFLNYFSPNGNQLLQYKIITQDPVYRNDLERQLDVKLERWAELMDIPDRDKETLTREPIEII